ncbi:MAG: GNAT family N-acetyltransferase [Acidobacteriia bacterium]|nr:GNAT family N-acetyltransferase [Terriglobia bacterium]
MPILIRRLEQNDGLKTFDCGDHRLNDYLKRHAWANQQQNLVGVTYVAADQSHPKLVIGYYTLATSSIPRHALPGELTKDLPRYQNLPVALLARLAVDLRFQGSGLGKELLRHALENVLSLSKQIGCRYLIVDAYPTAVKWYEKYGFMPIGETSPGGTQPMFLDVRTLELALQ